MVVDEALVGSIVVEEEGGDLANRWVGASSEVAVDESAGEAGFSWRAHHGDRVAVGVGRGLRDSCGNLYDEVSTRYPGGHHTA